MEKDARYFIVGLFVSATIAALAGFLIWLMGPQDDKNYNFYTIHFTESVSGLEEGANVEYKGVKAGKVLKMRLSPERSDLVRVDIGVRKDIPVRAGTQASLEMLGLTGLVRLQLATDPQDKRPPPHPEGEKYPVLQGRAILPPHAGAAGIRQPHHFGGA
jgi:phospholipid/cholesterol/gamma-HCH transport system substrate-binding protein